jgi:hypothetical protein
MFDILTLLKYFFEDFFVRQPLGQIDNLGLVLPSLPTYLILSIICSLRGNEYTQTANRHF